MQEQAAHTSPKYSSVPGYWEDAQGNLIPEKKVKPKHKAEDKLVRELFDAALAQYAAMRELRGRIFGEVDEFMELLRESYGVEGRGGKKGNLELTTYNGEFKVKVQVSDRLTLGEEVLPAQELVEACVADWSQGASDNLVSLVRKAFQADDSGALNIKRLLSLRDLEINDPRWQRAMEALNDAIHVSSSKRLARFYRRNAEGGYEPVPLDMSKMS